MEVSTHRHAGVEAGGVRAALKKLSFRGLNGWSSSKSSLDELDENRYVNSNGHCCHDVTTGINSDGGSNSSAADVASLTPITDVDTLAMLAAMDEANRSVSSY
jgi:hypothetical protein